MTLDMLLAWPSGHWSAALSKWPELGWKGRNGGQYGRLFHEWLLACVQMREREGEGRAREGRKVAKCDESAERMRVRKSLE